MAVRPDIALQAQGINPTAALAGGQQTAEDIKTAGIRQAMLNQQAANTVLESGLLKQRQETGELQIQEAQRQQSSAKSLIMNQLFKQLKKTPIAQRAGVASAAIPSLQGFGITPEQIGQLDVSDEGLDQGIAATSVFTQQQQGSTAAQKDFQFFQSIIEDPNSTPEQIRAAKIGQGTEASAGRGQLRETGVPGVFQVFDSNNNTLSAPMKRNSSGNLIPLTREEQLAAGLAERVEETEVIGEAETQVAVEKQRRLDEIALDKELKATDMKDFKVRRKTFIDQGVGAKDSLPNINRMIELNDRVITGGATALTKAVTDFMGMTSADLGEFNRRSGELVLSTIRQLGANPTEGERAFLELIQPSVGQSSEVNAAILADLKRIAERQAARAKKLQSNPDLDPNDLILNEPEFIAEFNGAPQQGPATQPASAPVIRDDGSLDNEAYTNSLFQ